MQSNYTRIFIGSQIEAQPLIGRLEGIGISAVVKDEAQSGRLAGFGSSASSSSAVYVHNDELEKAQALLNKTSDY